MNGMPVVISEGEDENELLVVEIQINKKKVNNSISQKTSYIVFIDTTFDFYTHIRFYKS